MIYKVVYHEGLFQETILIVEVSMEAALRKARKYSKKNHMPTCKEIESIECIGEKAEV